MVGSITFLKNEGDYVHKGDEVCIHALPLVIHCKNFFWCACKGATLSFFIQFGYFSFGGSTVICVFEKVCSSSHAKAPPPSFFFENTRTDSGTGIVVQENSLSIAGCNPIWCWSRGQQRKVTGNPCFRWHDSGRLHKEQGAPSPGAAEMFAWMMEVIRMSGHGRTEL